MRSLLSLLLLLAGVVSAQDGLLPSPIPQELRRYLELTDAQANGAQRLNAQLASYRTAKARRQFQVQQELADEMAKDPLDPTAIGLRHVELESIRREIEAEQRKTVEGIQALLTPAQRARLDGLAQVLRQHSTACSAVAWNFLTEPFPLPPAPNQGWATFVIVQPNLLATGGCAAGAIRGNFNALPFP